MWQWGIFSGCLLSENFLWRWNNVVFFFFLSFVNMGMGAWRWDSVKFFFLVVILPSPIPVALAPKKIYHMISVLNNIDHCRCPLAIYCKKKLSHDFSSHQYWLLPLPITIANPCCPLLLHIVVSSNFLDVRMEACGQELGNGSMGMWAWSMGMGAWRWDSEAFFCWLSFVKKIDLDGTVRQFFSGWQFCQFFTYEDGMWTGAWEGELGDVTILRWWNCHFLVVCFPTHFFLSYKFMITIYVFLYAIWFLILVDCLIHRITFLN